MSHERSSLRYKKVGKIGTICGRSGKDLYLSILGVSFYLVIINYNASIISFWGEFRPSITFLFTPIMAMIALIAVIFKLRHDVISNTLFNKKLLNNEFLPKVKFFYDYPILISFLSIVSWFLFAVVLFLNSEGFDTVIPDKIVAYAFVIPLFFVLYSFLNFYYCFKATQIYKDLEIKYSPKN